MQQINIIILTIINIANITANVTNAPNPKAANNPVTAPIITPITKLNKIDKMNITTSMQHLLFLLQQLISSNIASTS